MELRVERAPLMSSSVVGFDRIPPSQPQYAIASHSEPKAFCPIKIITWGVQVEQFALCEALPNRRTDLQSVANILTAHRADRCKNDTGFFQTQDERLSKRAHPGMFPTDDPRILFRHHISKAIRDVRGALAAAYGTEKIAQARARGWKIDYSTLVAFLAAIRATELYRDSQDRKDEIVQHRQSQRNAGRRIASPLIRPPRRLDEWEGAPEIPAYSARVLSLSHANEWLALALLGFSLKRPYPLHDARSLPIFRDALLGLYIKPRTLSQARDLLRKVVQKPFGRSPSPTLLRFHGLSPNTEIGVVAAAVFDDWKRCIAADEIRSGRPKSKPIRA